MTNYLLLAFSLFMNLLSGAFIKNDFCKKKVKTTSDLYIFNTVSAGVALLCFAVIGAIGKTLVLPSLYTLVMGVFFGVVTALCAVFSMLALRTGPLSYTNVIVFCSMVIPSLSGLVLYGESVSLWQYAGIAMMLLSFVFAVEKGNESTGAGIKWFMLCLGAFFCNGAVGVMQKIHQNSPHKDETAAFLMTAFTVYAVISGVCCLWYNRKKLEKISVTEKGSLGIFALYAVISGIGGAACNQINLYLAGAMPAVIFYPVFNGAAMLLTSVIGIVFFKEKLTKRQWIGLIAGSAAIILLCDVIRL